MIIRPAAPFLKPAPLLRPPALVRTLRTGVRPRPVVKSAPPSSFRLGRRAQ